MGKDEWILAADRYLADCRNCGTVPRATELAARMQLSPVQLDRAFRASVGTTVGHFLKERQIEHAKALLATTDLPAAAIAIDAGFGTPRSLFRAFRRCTGTTPGRFRISVIPSEVEGSPAAGARLQPDEGIPRLRSG